MGTKNCPYWTKRTKKHDIAIRLFMLLMDGEEHKIDEYYDWITQGVEPQMASRAYSRRFKTQPKDLEIVITEGKRIAILCALHRGEREKYFTVNWPEKEPPRSYKSHGFYDPRKCFVQLTETGRQHILNGHGVFGSMVSEMYSGIVSGNLKVKVEFLGIPDFTSSELETSEADLVLV